MVASKWVQAGSRASRTSDMPQRDGKSLPFQSQPLPLLPFLLFHHHRALPLGLHLHSTRKLQPQRAEAAHTSNRHKQRGKGMGEDEHGGHFIGWQVQKSRKNEQ